MSDGLEKIIRRIEEDASEKAAQILLEAKEQVENISREADREAARIRAEGQKKSASLRETLLERNRSAAHMQCQRELLAAKQQMIDETLSRAKKALQELDAKEYFAWAEGLLKKHVSSGAGQICFNEKDLERLPEDFMEKASKIAASAGGSLTLSETPAKIGGGFLLKYGGIEENCSIDALFEGEQERLRDEINEFLFKEA